MESLISARAQRVGAWMAARYRLGIRARFIAVLVVVVASLAAVGGVGLAAVASTRSALSVIYSDNVVNTQTIAGLASSLQLTQDLVLKGLLTVDPGAEQRVAVELASSVLPDVGVRMATIRATNDAAAGQAAVSERLSRVWSSFTRAFAVGGLGGASLAGRSARAHQLSSLLDQAAADVQTLLADEASQAQQRHTRAQATYQSNVRLMIVIIAVGLVVSLLFVVWLIRSILPRTLAYSRFAQRLAESDYTGRLVPRGADEIARLGRTLDDVATRRQESESYDRTQVEFSDALQLTEDELEAQDLLRRHLERSVSTSTVTVLNRNNSADRLQAVTALGPDSPLRESLKDATPRSCLAVRSAAVHTEASGEDALVSCEVCGGAPGISTCTPLLVSGEVIGAVLINRDAALDVASTRRLRESVRQAAPVIANLRNLAISQTRASTDTLTGLPNRRALDDTIKRMVAQASRATIDLAALMIDLDHFKQVNDQLGHSKGDEILAAFGTQLQDLLRESDFAARYGGEEFLVLLPSTGAGGAAAIAEKIRLATRALHIPGVDRKLTISIGIAVLPDHALDADGLERAADRALYLAKTNGRDRIELAVPHGTPDAPEITVQDENKMPA